MMEFIVTEHPHLFPQACVSCLSQKGPLVDTHAERPGWGHVYVCKRCAKSFSRLFGFAPGKNLDLLEQTLDLHTADEREKAIAFEERDAAREALFQSETVRKELLGKNKLLETRVEQLESRLREEAEHSLAVVGDR